MGNEFDSPVNAFGGAPASDITFDVPEAGDSTEDPGKYSPPTGDWVGTVLDIEHGKTKADKPQIIISFALDVEGRQFELRYYVLQTPANIPRTASLFDALGVKPGKKTKADILGKRCICSVKREVSTYAAHKGAERSNITWCKALSEAGPGQLPADPNDDMVF